MTPALKAIALTRTFDVGKRLFGPPRASVQAVNQVSFEVRTGETLGIVGESGCGKSTLARMLVGLLPPTSGRIEIEGCALEHADPVTFGRLVQYVFQDPVSSLNPRKTIRQIIESPLRNLHSMSGTVLEGRIAELLEAVNMPMDFLSRFPHELSGGQAQRIGIARALAANPRILILDEPVSALDASVQAQVLNLLADLKVRLGLTYLFISHDLAVVEAVSDHIAVLYFGSLVESGAAEKVFASPRHPYTKLLVDSAPVVGRKLAGARSGELPDPLNPPPGCSFAGRCAWASDLCLSTVPKLQILEGDSLAACHHTFEQ